MKYTFFIICAFISYTLHAQELEIIEQLDIAPVWAGHRVGFDITTVDSLQYVAFYDAERKMTIAKRSLGSDQWQFTALPSTVGWDSHNYIAMLVDDSGYIHISGNMHADPLVYFRSTAPRSIDEFESPGMVGTLEDRVTYPRFFRDKEGSLIYQYRIGGSGNGNTIWNGYDIETKTWERLTEDGLFNGEGEVNAYHSEPLLGPDGFFHMVWMWRDTPIANTNHHISHMKSLDLVNWQTMAGQAVTLPVTQSTPGVVVDPVGPGNGLINVGFGIGWDSQGRGVVTYHKYGEQGFDQIYNSRREGDQWTIYQTSSWTSYRFDLERGGSLNFGITASPLQIDNQDRLIQSWNHNEFGTGTWVLDETDLSEIEDIGSIIPDIIKQLLQVESNFPGMGVRMNSEGEWYLRWETLASNQDRPWPEPWPEPGMLRVYKLSIPEETNIINRAKKEIKFHQLPGKIVLDFESPGNYQIEIKNPEGKSAEIYQSRDQRLEISSRNLRTGVYFIVISNSNFVVGKNLIVIK